MTETLQNSTETVIEPPRGLRLFSIWQLGSYRELLTQMILREISLRYQHTTLGILWAILNPALTAGIFSVVFGLLARIPVGETPYLAFFLAGLVPWSLFAATLGSVADSMLKQRALLTKVYFPRIIAPLAASGVPIIDYAIALLLLLLVAAAYGIIPVLAALWVLPLTMFWAWISAFGLGLCFAALNVRYRDVGQIVPFIVRIGMFASPVLYPVSMIPERMLWIYCLNPAVGVIEWTRWSLFATGPMPGPVFFISIPVAILLLLCGSVLFRRMEDSYADVV